MGWGLWEEIWILKEWLDKDLYWVLLIFMSFLFYILILVLKVWGGFLLGERLGKVFVVFVKLVEFI